jgi:hypothetical protein
MPMMGDLTAGSESNVHHVQKKSFCPAYRHYLRMFADTYWQRGCGRLVDRAALNRLSDGSFRM